MIGRNQCHIGIDVFFHHLVGAVQTMSKSVIDLPQATLGTKITDTLPSGANLSVNLSALLWTAKFKFTGRITTTRPAISADALRDLVEVLKDPRLVSGPGVDHE